MGELLILVFVRSVGFQGLPGSLHAVSLSEQCAILVLPSGQGWSISSRRNMIKRLTKFG
jgi:hypothetical protein